MTKKKWQRPLTAKEVKHIRETTETGTLEQFKQNRARQIEDEAADFTPCWACRMIARKLGVD